MKHIKLLCLMLVLLMILPSFAACKKNGEQNTEEVSSEEKLDIAGIPKREYNTTFKIKDQTGYLFQSYYWSESAENATNMSLANYNREVAIENHLGIEIIHQSYSGIYSIAEEVGNMILVGADDTQLALTHPFAGLATLMPQGNLLDLATVPGISLNGEYWNEEIMNQVKFQGHSYLGSSSFILHEPTFLLFNKDMADDYPEIGVAALYEHVRNKTWTIEQMMIYAEMIDTSLNESLTDPKAGTYGMALYQEWVMSSFVTASGIYNCSIDSDDKLQLNPFSEELFDVFKKLVALNEAAYTYTWGYNQYDKELSMSTGRALFSVVDTYTMIDEMTSSEITLGVLPVPGMNAGETIKSLDWAGYFVIPASVQNQQMSGEVAELLSYYGKTKVEHEFYDVLLGLRASDSAEDQEMLELIFDNLTVDPIMPMLDLSTDVYEIFYSTVWQIQKGNYALRSHYQKFYESARQALESVNA